MIKIVSYLSLCVLIAAFSMYHSFKNPTTMTNCLEDIRLIQQKNLLDWKGLRSPCLRSEIEAHFNFEPGEGRHIQPKNGYETRFNSLILPNFEEPLFFHYHQDTLVYLMTDYWSFDEDECRKIIKKLGTPEAKLDFAWHEFILKKKEWVYPERGLSLALNEDEKLIIQVFFFPPCTLEYYEQYYHRQSEYREFEDN
ncbi:MAG: hypothetical protein NW226_14480 [Microscillaceae bacterium]|nr:hypothetical protein [Microscillaceae bacterium]